MHFRLFPLRALAALGLLLGAACAPSRTVPAESAAEEGAFITRLGTDTLFVERFTRTPRRLEGEVVVRTPVTATRRYIAELLPDGTIGRFEVELQTLGRPQPLTPYRYIVEPEGDSLRVRYERGDTVEVTRIAAGPGTIPHLRGSYALYEQAVRQVRAAGADSAQVEIFSIGAPRTSRLGVRVAAPDTVVLTDIAGPAPARVDARGRILGIGTPGRDPVTTVERLPTADVQALAAGFAAQDRAGRGLGVLSPRDSVAARIAGATVSVGYGRPSMRGRTIMGGVVPWNEVWRTGANEATHLRTDRDLVMGGVTIPAGSYTLWTLPSPEGWKLIVNRQTGQWGTTYDPAHDLAHVDMVVDRLAEPVEQLTIAIEPQGEGGVLMLTWENTRARVPFTVR